MNIRTILAAALLLIPSFANAQTRAVTVNAATNEIVAPSIVKFIGNGASQEAIQLNSNGDADVSLMFNNTPVSRMLDLRMNSSANLYGGMLRYWNNTGSWKNLITWTDSIRIGIAGAATSDTLYVNGTFGTSGAMAVGGGSTVQKFITAATTWDPGSLANGASEKKSSITVTGVAVGDPVTASLTTIISSDWAVQACVTATNTVEVKITNNTGGVVDLASGTLRINCVKF